MVSVDNKVLTKIIKFGKFAHINSLYSEGIIFFNTVAFFRETEKEDARYDKMEGANSIDQLKRIFLEIDGKKFTLSRSGEKGSIKLINANIIEHIDVELGNIFSCSAITNSNYDDFQNIDPRFLEFGDTVVLIEDPDRFLLNIEQELKKLNFKYYIGLVQYYDRNEKTGELSYYDKPSEYKYQNELRIFIYSDLGEPLKLQIPHLMDYSYLYKL